MISTCDHVGLKHNRATLSHHPSDHDFHHPWFTENHLLGSTWIAYTLGALFADRLTDIPTELSWFIALITLSVVCLISLRIKITQIDERIFLVWVPPILILCALSGGLVEASHHRSLGEESSPPIETDQGELTLHDIESTTWIGEGVVIKSRARHDRVTFLIELKALIASDHQGKEDQSLEFKGKRTLKNTLRAIISISTNEAISSQLSSGDQVFISGTLRWIGGRIEPHLQGYKEWLSRQRVAWKAKGHLILRETSTQKSLIQVYRTQISTALDSMSSHHTDRRSGYDLTRALILGDSSRLSSELIDAVRRMGLGHLFAVSGLHIGICALLLMWVARWISVNLGSAYPSLWGWGMMVCGAWVYLGISGAPLSAQRATLMLTLWAGSRLLLSPLSALTTLWLTAWILVLMRPSIAHEMGLQLSLVATFGLTVNAESISLYRHEMTEREAQRYRLNLGLLGFVRFLASGLYVSIMTSAYVALIAWLYTSPIFVWHLGEMNLVAPIYNTVLTPLLSALLIPLALFGSLIAPLTTIPLFWVATLGDLIARMSLSLKPPLGLTISIGQGNITLVIIAVVMYWMYREHQNLSDRCVARRLLLGTDVLVSPHRVLQSREGRSRRRFRVLISLLLLGSLAIFQIVVSSLRSPVASMNCLYVGQGDATLIRSGDGRDALFDVGPHYSAPSLIKNLKLRGVRQLDWVAISHLHPDHYGALPALLDNFIIKEVIYHGRDPLQRGKSYGFATEGIELDQGSRQHQTSESNSWRQIVSLLNRHHTALRAQSSGIFRWGKLELNWLFDPPSAKLSENDSSLALLITSTTQNRYRALLSGDLEEAGEERLRESWRERDLHHGPLAVWQINHHGSSTSTKEDTVKLLRPIQAVMSLDGEHKFGFPHAQTMRTLNAHQVRMTRLDLDGDFTYLFEDRSASIAEQFGIVSFLSD